ncbi:MAG TPA: hypothetical protein VEB43_09080 [Anaeromyxobacter sp.]|nr:hypothetical protein [Anaeromyxobacter sp.]
MRPLSASLLALVALLAARPAAGQEARKTRFELRPSGSGPQRLDVPPEFLSASARGDLADLRLRDAAGKEVQYLLIPPAEEPDRWIRAATIRPVPPTKLESGAELDLGAVRNVAALEVAFAEAGFLKRARLEGSADGRRWVVLAPELVLYQLPLDPAACGGETCPGELVRREVRFEPAAARYLRLVLDDRRSPRLRPPTQARALLARELAPAPGPTISLPAFRRPSEPGTSRLALHLPGPHLPVRAIVLELDAERLARRARILEARLAGGRLAPVELGSAMLLQVERGGLHASALRIPVDRPEELELELVVEDGDNAPFQLTDVRAELAPLPWIYFESADGAPLEARLGDPGRAAPRYDLEALRPELSRVRPRAAAAAPLASEERTADARPATAVPEAAGPGAALDRKAFRFSRTVEPAPPGLAAVRIDPHVLARSELSELRIATPDGRQLPYLLERRDEPLELRLEERTGADARTPAALARRGVTVHVLDVPERRLPGSRLVLSTLSRVFSRQVRIYAEPERSGAPAFLAAGPWEHANPDRAAPPLTLELPPLRSGRLLVAVDDGDNAPLAIAGRLLLPSYRLRFFHPGPALTLLFGAELPAPQYDLALLAPRLRSAAAREVALVATEAGTRAAEPAPDGPAPSRGARLAFWIVLGAAVAGLLALVTRLLARGDGRGPTAAG